MRVRVRLTMATCDAEIRLVGIQKAKHGESGSGGGEEEVLFFCEEEWGGKVWGRWGKDSETAVLGVSAGTARGRGRGDDGFADSARGGELGACCRRRC